MALQTPSRRMHLHGGIDVRQVPPHKRHHGKRGVYVDTEEVHFPSVVVGRNSVAKVSLHNRTTEAATFEVGSLDPHPFQNYYQVVNVKPKHYLNIPIRYTPSTEGTHVATLELRNASDPKQLLKAKLIGKTVRL